MSTKKSRSVLVLFSLSAIIAVEALCWHIVREAVLAIQITLMWTKKSVVQQRDTVLVKRTVFRRARRGGVGDSGTQRWDSWETVEFVLFPVTEPVAG